MGLFTSNNESRPRNPDAVFGFRALAAGYILYMVYQIVMTYVNGEATTGVWFLVLSIVLLGGGAIFVLVSSYLGWRKEKAALAAQEEETAEQTQS